MVGHIECRICAEDPENNFFLARDDAEDDPGHKQIIPYAIFHHEGRFLHYVRGGGGGEKRLASKGSIGIGGHINPVDDQSGRSDLVFTAARRELDEELIISPDYSLTPVGIINDDANPVGSVHFGVVLVARLQSAAAEVREHDTLEGSFLPIDEAVALAREPDANFETWSSLILENLQEAIAQR